MTRRGENRTVSEAADFIDAALRYEGSEYRAADARERLGSELSYYGASLGAVRGTIRNALLKYPGLGHDHITALSSELWAGGVFERRLAAIVLLQAHLPLLRNTDLTRIEGFVRSALVDELLDPLITEVLAPLLESPDSTGRAKAEVVLDRWSRSDDRRLRRAALIGRTPH